jgi:hypothetical protein
VEPHAIDIHSQALLFDVITVALGRRVVVNELTAATDTDMILPTSSMSILTDVSGLIFRALHQN